MAAFLLNLRTMKRFFDYNFITHCRSHTRSKIQFTMPEQQNTDKGMFTSIKEGILYVKESPFLSTFLICSAFLNLFLIGPMQVGFPLFVKMFYTVTHFNSVT